MTCDRDVTRVLPCCPTCAEQPEWTAHCRDCGRRFRVRAERRSDGSGHDYYVGVVPAHGAPQLTLVGGDT